MIKKPDSQLFSNLLHAVVRAQLVGKILLGLAIILAILVMMQLMPLQLVADEHSHVTQVMLFMANQFYLDRTLTMPPGSHAIIAVFSKIFNIDTLSGIRLVGACVSLTSLIFIYAFLRQSQSAYPVIQTAQLFAVPLLWPFFWVLYTDLSSLSIIMIALILVSRQHYVSSALLCILALFFRQSNIFWALLFWLMAISYENRIDQRMAFFQNPTLRAIPKVFSSLWKALYKTRIFFLPILLFGIFTYLNGGVALGDRNNQQFGGIYPFQIYFLFLVLWIILLPLHIANLPKIFNFLKQYMWVFVLLSLGFILYLLCFKLTHPHNFPSDYFIRNWFLFKMKDSFRLRVLLYIPIAWTFLSLCVIRLKSSEQYWLYPVTILSILPISLLEQRYFIVPFVLLMLFRKPQGLIAENSLLLWCMLLSIPLTWGIVTMKYFL